MNDYYAQREWELTQIAQEHLRNDIDNLYLLNIQLCPSCLFQYDMDILGGVTRTICIGGVLHRTSQWDTVISEQMILTITLHTNIIQYNRDDIITAFCDGRDNDEWNGCPYVKHYWGDYYTPDEYGCPSDFCPDIEDCPYNDIFIEMVVEGLQSLGIDVDDEGWEIYGV